MAQLVMEAMAQLVVEVQLEAMAQLMVVVPAQVAELKMLRRK
jgi:hypothetical protein